MEVLTRLWPSSFREDGSAQAVLEKRPSRAYGAVVLLMLAAVLALVVAVAPSERAWAASDTSWYRGHESATTYTISNANQLAGLADLVNGGTDFAGKTVRLGALPGAGPTLRLSGEWKPIGTEAHPFNGTFDGNKGSVTSLSISKTTNGAGLFGYAGSQSVIKNLTVSGAISLNLPVSSKAVVKNVGAVVGSTQGSVSGCTSSVRIGIVSAVAATEKEPSTINDVGGIAGYVRGSIADCTMTSRGSVRTESSAASYSSDISWVITDVGGIAGSQGPGNDDFASFKNPGTISNCVNEAKVYVLTYAPGPLDRFDNATNANSNFEGGIVGYATGNIRNCRNTGAVDSAYYDAAGKPKNAYGCRGVGGIVGALRVDDDVRLPSDSSDPGLRYNHATGETAPISIEDCSNTGNVFGLGQAGGIVGQAGSYTTVTRCWNTGRVEASRYTKPSPGGVVGRTYGNVSYCYNTGNVVSTTGGGYYAAGVVGMLHSLGADKAGNTLVPEMYACYNTGYIETDSIQYRAGSIVGELDGGYIHDCFSLAKRCYRDDVSGLDNPTGTIADSVVIVSESDALAVKSIELLNTCAAKDGWKTYFTLPKGASYGQLVESSGVTQGPALAGTSRATTASTDLTKVSATVTTTADAAYSAASDPIPTVSVKLSNGTVLTQNVDFRVIPQAGTAGVAVSATKYQATIEGIGPYKGRLSQKATYQIGKGPLSSCTVSAQAKYFNWQKQKPDTVTVRDAAGNVVDPSQYTWSVDEKLYNDASDTAYVNAQDPQAAKGYPITVTATASGNYEGSQTADCFKIISVSFATNGVSDNPNQETLQFGKITYGSQSWNFNDVCDTDANGGMGTVDKRGTMKIKYTGSPIKPVLSGVTYMGKPLKEIKEGDSWYNDPKGFGYKVLYGNPNPELGSSTQDSNNLENVTNVTKGTNYAAMTVRSAPYSNFDNYITVYFAITPASLEDDCTMTGFQDTVAYNGQTAMQDKVTFTYNGMTLQQGRDYVALYQRGDTPDTMKVVFNGVGNYSGTIYRTYKTTGAPAGYSDVKSTDWFAGVVSDVSVNGFMGAMGQGSTQFAPNVKVSRAMVATVLYRIASGQFGPVNNNIQSPFKDVPSGEWYTAAVAWCHEHGLVYGYTDVGLFKPNQAITRQELGVMISRLADYYGVYEPVEVSKAFSSELKGVDKIDDWAIERVAWCVDKGMFNNYGNLDPRGSALRCHMAKLLILGLLNGVFPQSTEYLTPLTTDDLLQLEAAFEASLMDEATEGETVDPAGDADETSQGGAIGSEDAAVEDVADVCPDESDAVVSDDAEDAEDAAGDAGDGDSAGKNERSENSLFESGSTAEHVGAPDA